MGTYHRTDLSAHVLTITLSRVGAQNALIPEQLSELADLFASLPARKDIHTVVLQSDSAAFSIGGDMYGFDRHFPDIRGYAEAIVGELNRMILAMIDAPQPIVAAVHGVVTGGSIGFILASDLVLVTPQAVFKAHYPSAGFSPDGGWGVLLPRIIGPRRAAECLLLNKSFNAEQAVAWGIANAVVELDAVRDEAHHMAHKIAAYPVGTMCSSKHLLWRERAQIAADLDLERRLFVERITAGDAQESVRRFLDLYKDYPSEDAQ